MAATMTASNGSGNKNDLSLQFSSFVKATSPTISDSDIERMYKTTTETEHGKEWLASVVTGAAFQQNNNITLFAAGPGGFGWQKSAPANCQVASVVFFLTARLSIQGDIDKQGSVKFGGLFTPGVIVVWGTYYYNDAAQTTNDGSMSAMVSAQGVSTQVTLFKNNVPQGYFIGGGVGTVAGVGGGTWSQ